MMNTDISTAPKVIAKIPAISHPIADRLHPLPLSIEDVTDAALRSLALLQKRRRRCPHELRTSSSLHAPPHEPSSVTRPVQMRPFASEVVVSKDGTMIGYRQLG